jgi:hypothetical protein
MSILLVAVLGRNCRFDLTTPTENIALDPSIGSSNPSPIILANRIAPLEFRSISPHPERFRII